MKSIPDHCQPYKRTPTFSETNVPTGLLNAHQTKEGTWGKIVILEGRLLWFLWQTAFALIASTPAHVELARLNICYLALIRTNAGWGF